MYSHGRLRRLLRPAFTPRAYASICSRCSGEACASTACATWRKRKSRAVAILRKRDLAEDLRKLAGREPARQIHLEETILAVREAEAVGEIGASGRKDGRNASESRGDAHRRTEARRPSPCHRASASEPVSST